MVETRPAILLVDDELSFLTLLQYSLQDLACELLPTLNLHDARELWQKRKKEIKLLITDFSLPDGFGSDLAAHFLDESPELKAIIITGFRAESVSLPPLLASRAFLMEKPFSGRELKEVINACLSNPLGVA